MAKASWVTTNPSSGSGNSSVSVSATAHTGRNARQTTLTFKAANVSNVTRTVIQAGAPNKVEIDEASAPPKEGQSITISGKANSKKLTFTIKDGATLPISAPLTYIVAGNITTTNGEEISGDPGASSEYIFSVQFLIPSNTGLVARVAELVVTDENSNSDVCTITQAAGDAYLSVTMGDINLPADGSETVTIQVTSNTNWTIS